MNLKGELTKMNLTQEEWIKRVMDAGISNADYANILWLAYTDDGVCVKTPEEVAAIAMKDRPQFKQNKPSDRVEYSSFTVNRISICGIVTSNSIGEIVWSDDAEKKINDDAYWSTDILCWRPIVKVLWEAKKAKEEKKEGWFLDKNLLSEPEIKHLNSCLTSAKLSKDTQTRTHYDGQDSWYRTDWIRHLTKT